MITEKQVADWLKMKNGPSGDIHLPIVVSATNALIARLPDIDVVDQVVEGVPLKVWAPTTVLAATMFAARLYQRRNSPNGVEAVGEMGTTYVARYDPDIARMLYLDSFQLPQVG